MSLPKFRAWDMYAEKIIYQEDNGDEYIWMIGANDIWVEHIKNGNQPGQVLMQSTGLKDKNGVESWEGNYLTRDGYPSYVIERVSEYGCLMAVAVDPIQKANWKPEMVRDLLNIDFVNDSNIHANPELLKEVE